MHHLNAQTCVKMLEILNERTQLPAPWYHSVFTDPHLFCGLFLGVTGAMLPPSQSWPEMLARLLSGERILQSKLGSLGPKVCGY